MTTTTADPPPEPVTGDRRYDWPRHEVRHLIATLPLLPRGWMRAPRPR